MAIASLEAVWFASQGNKLVRSTASVQNGDLVFFSGAHPDSNVEFPPIGHVGMATTSTEYVSAYDTAVGVVIKNLDSDFIVAIRLP